MKKLQFKLTYKTVHNLVKVLICTLLCLCLGSINLQAQRQTENSFRSKFGPNALVGYYAYVPADYTANPSKNYPILIYLHGAGDKAWNPSDLSQLPLAKTHGPSKLIEQGQDFPFIVITPQCPFSGWDDVTTDNFATSQLRPGEFVDEILEKMKTLYRVDLNRIYITGISMGGASAWEYTQNYPQKIAASIPIAGWCTGAKACDIAAANVAVWTFQGELDGAGGITSLVNKINTCNPVPTPLAKVTVYSGVGHDAWTQTYDNTGPGIAPDNIYDWLMRQSKIINNPPVVNAGTDKTYTLSTNVSPPDSLKISGSATDDIGISSVLWTKVSGPSVTLKNTAQQTLTLKNLSSGTYKFRLTAKDGPGLTAFDEVTVIINPSPSSPIVDNTDWKLKAISVTPSDNDAAIIQTLTTGADFTSENTLPANTTESISVKLPVLSGAGMFTFSFKGSISGIQVNTYQSDDGITWETIKLANYTNGRGDDLQKADIPLSVSNKWFRISFVNTNASAAVYKEIGMYQFKAGVNNQYFLFLGASITESAGGHTEWAQTIKSRINSGLQPVIFNWSLSGETSAGIKTRTDEFLAQHPKASCVLIEAGGNDVSASRPLTFDKRAGTDVKAMETNIRYIIQAVKNAGKLPLLSRLSYRNYVQMTSWMGFDQPPVNGGLNQENGSLPFNYTLDKIIKEMTPMFWDSTERRGTIDFYPFTLNNQSWLVDGDGVHFYGPSTFHIREFWSDYAFRYLYTGLKAPVMIYNEYVPGLTAKAETAVAKAELSQLEKDIWDARILVDQVANRTNRLAFEDRLSLIGLPKAPTITLQPLSKTVITGSSVTFSVAASGTPVLTYQWKKNNVTISGAVQSTYTYTPGITDNNAVFTCIVSNAIGSTPSSGATLTVNAVTLPVITQNPASISAEEGSAAAFSVVATGSGLTYQWQKDSVNISGATQSTYSISSVQAGLSGASFRCLVTNSAGTVISGSASLAVTSSIPVVNGLTGYYFSNGNGKFTAPLTFSRIDQTIDFNWLKSAPAPTMSYDNFTIRWKGKIKAQTTEEYTLYARCDDGIIIWVNNKQVITKWGYNGDLEYSAKILLTANQLTDIKIEYMDGVSNALCKLSWSSASVPKQIIPSSALFPENTVAAVAPTITQQPVAQAVTEGSPATFSLVVSGTAPFTYQWLKNNAAITGATQASYTLPATSYADNNSLFKCIVTNSEGTATSLEVALTVNPVIPSITLQPQSATLIEGATATFTVAASGTAPLTYQWKKNGIAISGATLATFSIPVTQLSDNGAQFSCVVTNAAGSTPSANAVLTVNPVVTSVVNGLTGRYYKNVYASFSNTVALTRTDANINFNWLTAAPDPVVGADIFAVRWTGKIQPAFTETYTFYTQSDDGIKLWVNDVLLVDKWVYQGTVEYSGSIALTAGVKYNIKIEYFDGNGNAVCKLFWKSASVAKQIVPSANLFPEVNLRQGESVEETMTAGNENSGLTIYPTLADHILCVDNGLPGNKIIILTTNGVPVKEGIISGQHECLNVDDLSTGPYFIRIGEQTKLFMKR